MSDDELVLTIHTFRVSPELAAETAYWKKKQEAEDALIREDIRGVMHKLREAEDRAFMNGVDSVRRP